MKRIRQTRLIIARYELYPKEAPNRYLVGFRLMCDINGRENYHEVGVPVAEADGKNEHEVCVIAYNKSKDNLQKMIAAMEAISPIIGSEFIPPEEAIVQAAEEDAKWLMADETTDPQS